MTFAQNNAAKGGAFRIATRRNGTRLALDFMC
jgi:hypothetical protein